MAARARNRKSRRKLRLVAGTVALLLILLFGRPALHLLRAAWRDRAALDPIPMGNVNDASRLNLTAVNETIDVSSDPVEAEKQLIALVNRAREQNLHIAIAGSRHTMGGHTIYSGGIALNMSPFDHFELDESTNVLHTQSGARWDQIIPYLDQRGRSIQIMQSNNSFTVGGSISANCHGWQPERPPIASTVLAFRLLGADGEIVHCSRSEDPELFSLALGGYGLFGVILDVDLKVTTNERYTQQRFAIDGDQLAVTFQHHAIGKSDVGMAYGRMCVVPGSAFLREAVVNVFHRAPCKPEEMPVLSETSMASIKRTIFRGSAESDYGKELRWEIEKTISDQFDAVYVSRNQLLNDSAGLYQDHSIETTDILHEYFVPPELFNAFLAQMRKIVPKHRGNLLNVTVRHVLRDDDTFLRYAVQEMLALVLMFNQHRTARADAEMEAMTRELIDAARALDGCYYLPYRLHATQDQFDLAYPQGREFFNLKRKYDPQEVFQNEFYLKYGHTK